MFLPRTGPNFILVLSSGMPWGSFSSLPSFVDTHKWSRRCYVGGGGRGGGCTGASMTLTPFYLLSSPQAHHGCEPAFTWPSGLRAPLMDIGDPHCADYIYLWQSPAAELVLHEVCLCGDNPAPGDPSLYPSDHIGIKVQLQVVKKGESAAAATTGGGSSKQQQQPVGSKAGTW